VVIACFLSGKLYNKRLDSEGQFYITNKDHCPAIYHKAKAEELLSKAVKIYGDESKHTSETIKRQAEQA